MKNIRNKQLQRLCEEQLDLKEIILNFDDGLVYIYSDDDKTESLLTLADSSIIAGEGGGIYSFRVYTIQQWFNIIKEWYDNLLVPNL